MKRRLRRAVTGTGRWIRPSRSAVVALTLAVLGSVATAAWAFRWAVRSESPARTLALAGSVLRGPLVLDSALTVTWTWSVSGTASLANRWLTLVAPELPPGICVSPDPSGPADRATDAAGGGALGSDLDLALRQLDAAVSRRVGRDELERRLLAVRTVGSAPPGSRTDFLVRYNLARGYAAAGDWATADELIAPVLDGWISLDRVPETQRGLAAGQASGRGIDETLALDALHGRYLAGAVAYHRAELPRAVTHFRRAINTVNYLLALRGGDELAPEGHYQRIEAGLGPSRCPGSGTDEMLTSLDAYAGLVASYMAYAEFHDPGGLSEEVVRTRIEIDQGDPFRPILDHARLTRGDPDLTPVPENLLWAASNLQRVYHYNRLRPEPRLEVTRAVLLLHLTRRPEWVEALRSRGGADVCDMLLGIGEDLQSDAAALELGRPTYSATDSARAAVAVQTFARLERDCEGAEAPVVEPPVRSAWIRLGGSYLTLGLGGMYEGMRREILDVLADGRAPVAVMEERLGPPVERARGHLRALRRGRVPGEMSADLPVELVRGFVEEWWRALYVDVARSLIEEVRTRPTSGSAPIRAAEVPDLLGALESAVAHAGAGPNEFYTAGELGPLASTQGRGAGWLWSLRGWVRGRPVLTMAGLALAATGASLTALLIHVNWWRYRILTGSRLYVAELRKRESTRARGSA